MPDVAIFGEKDYQQLQIIKRLVKDIDIPVQIVGGAIVRETDGLAMSSRNLYLSAAERKIAPNLFATLNLAANKLLSGDLAAKDIPQWGGEELLRHGFSKVDYFEVRDGEDLQTTDTVLPSARLLAAAFLGKTRLIDNLPVK